MREKTGVEVVCKGEAEREAIERLIEENPAIGEPLIQKAKKYGNKLYIRLVLEKREKDEEDMEPYVDQAAGIIVLAI